MKSWSIMLAGVILLFLTSAKSTEVSQAVVGSEAPQFRFERTDSKSDLRLMRGKYVIVTFWSLSDAASRIANAQYSRMEALSSTDISHVGVCIDSDRELWHHVVDADGLDASGQYTIQDVRSDDLISDYHLETGNRTYLIDPMGKIVAVNPDENQLRKLLL